MKNTLLLLMFFIFMGNMNAQQLVRGPYLNMVYTGSATVRWRTDSATISTVKYGTDKNNLNQVVSLANQVIDHIVTLQNLAPDTKYYYSVGYGGIVLQADSQNYFRTAPISNPNYDKPIRMWAVGDMAKGNPRQIEMMNAFSKYVDTNYIDGYVMLGDNAYDNGYDIDYQLRFFDYYKNHIKHIPLLPVLGNHDYANNYTLRTNHQISYFDIFSLPQNAEMGGVASNTERYYSFDYGNIHFIMLDSYGLENVGGNYYGLADTAFSPQVLWLKNDLQQNTLPWTIVCYHHPPYCMGTHNSDWEQDLVAFRMKLNPILESYNVDLVLCGHCHTYQRSNMIKNHFGLEATFDSTLNLVQNTSGRYDGSPNSCMYIKNGQAAKDTGVIYMVIGSGSAVPQAPYPQWPHNAMSYSNYLDNGSMYLTVEGNELNVKWISTDTNQVVKDQFTILKNANNKKIVSVNMPSVVDLSASWRHGKYTWSNGDTNRTIHYFATTDTTIYVTDLYNCITDTFQIINNPNPQNVVENSKLEIQIYPNPTQNKLTLQLPENGIYFYSIFNLLGEKLVSSSFNSIGKKSIINLDSKILDGTYYLLIQDSKKTKHAINKFVKQE